LTDETRQLELQRFFRERIVPAALELRERGVEFFAQTPDRTQRSYWHARPEGEGYVFQISEDLAAELHVLWREYAELHVLAGEVADMTRALAEQRDESADVSSFIYAMF
jgi:hypothetical protein